ncbi:hypothetical protein [Deferribacter abyssi]|uniref:hypothetical protein n=1 Tax=Deferribacter abyssi TaxID=213806 RepID=UPI003C1F0966
MTKEFGVDNVDFKYVDISSPEVLDYIDDVNNIVENRFPLPYVSVNKKPVVWGLDDPQEIFMKITEFVKNYVK